MKYTFINAGIPEEVEFSDVDIELIFKPLLQRLTLLQKEKNRRILVFLAAAPGAGKSTLVDFLKYLSTQNEKLTEITAIGMDGFHHYQDYLLAHSVIRDGKEINMVEIKGAPITFDLPLLKERIKELRTREIVGWPTYNRKLHNPVENAITVTGNIVILEGNYLLLNEGDWNTLKEQADYTIKLTADEEFLRDRLIKRKISTGVDEKSSIAFVDFSDMYNVRTCLNHSSEADLEIKVLPGQYVVTKDSNKTFSFRKAKKGEAEMVYSLIEQRVQWMNEKGIQQWNTTDYLNVYPFAYYQDHLNQMYVLTENNQIVCAALLFEEDERWDSKEPAYYIHNFVSSSMHSRVGQIFMNEVEKYALNQNKLYLRLDSADDNLKLEEYYESLGFVACGTCQDGDYKGVLRQKKVG